MDNLISHIVELTHSVNYSDLQIETGGSVKMRTAMGWSDTGYGEVIHKDIESLMERLDRDWKKVLDAQGVVDRAIDLSTCRLRCNAYYVAGGRRIALSIRRLPRTPMSLEETGLPPQAIQFTRAPKGLLLVCGATGSGKTTSLAAIIERINETRPAHIITIEDPIEYVFEPKQSIITQREVGVDTVSFASGLHESLRQRPDVILIGEIRDADTADTAMRAAESGHFVMATIHARSAVGAIQKMVSFFPDVESRSAALSASLVGVLFQVLVPSIDGSRLHLAVEMLLNNAQQLSPMIADPNRHRAIDESLRRQQLNNSGIFLNNSLTQLVNAQKISKEAALAASYAPQEMFR